MSGSRALAGLVFCLLAPVALATTPVENCVEWPVPAISLDAKSVLSSQQVGNLRIIEFSGDYSRGNTAARQQIAQHFYGLHPDAFDALVVFTGFEFDSGGATALYHPVRNQITGIGQQIFDFSANFGSSGRLSGIVDMAALSRYELNPRHRQYPQLLGVLTHELWHRFAARVQYRTAAGALSGDLLGESGSHWNYFLDTDASLMYGSDWQPHPQGFESVQVRHRLSMLDLYLGGLAAASEVPPMDLIRGGTGSATDLPRRGAITAGTVESITIEQIVAAEGARLPATAQAQREFSAAFVLLVRPGTSPSAEQLLQLEQLRIQSQQFFQAATMGRATLRISAERKAATPVTAPVTLLPLHPAAGSTPASVIELVLKLRQMQKPDGSFGELSATAVRDTALALRALEFWQPDDPRNTLTRQWLAGRAGTSGADQQRWITLGLGASAPAASQTWATQHDGLNGFGNTPYWQASVPDTLLASRSLRTLGRSSEASASLQRVASQQRPDGGLAWTGSGPANEAAVALLADEIAQSVLPDAGQRVSLSRSWLEARQRGDGGFGSPQSTLHDSATVLSAAARLGLSTTRRAQLRDYLLLRAGSDGPVLRSAGMLALTLNALALEQGENLAIEGPLSAVPEQPFDGQQVQVTATVRNTGSSPVSPTVARWFEGDPQSGGSILGADQPVPALQPGQAQVLNLDWDTTGRTGTRQLYLLIDATAVLAESREDDNQGRLNLVVAAAPQAPELALFSAETALDPAVLSNVPSLVKVRGRVHNLGQSAVSAQVLELQSVQANSTSSLARTVLAVPARGHADFELQYTQTQPNGRDLRLLADADAQFAEADEDNNQVDLRLQFGSNVDVSVAAEDLSVTPASPEAGSVVQLAVRVHNRGTEDVQDLVLRIEAVNGGQTELIQQLQLGLTAGSNQLRQLSWRPAAAGAMLLRVQLDPANLLAESDENNNQVERALTVQPATGINLYPQPGSLVYSPTPALEGQPLQATVSVQNLGAVSAGAFAVGLYDTDPASGGVLLTTAQVTGLAAGASTSVSLQIPRLGLRGPHTPHVLVDSAQQIEERNETDNTLSAPLQVLALPDLVLGSAAAITLDPALPIDGQPLTVRVRVENLGEQPAPAAAVRLLLGLPEGGSPVGPDQLLPVLPPGGSAQLEWSLVHAAATTALSASVDPQLLISEIREDNNQAIRAITSQNGEQYASPAWFSPNGDGVQDRTTLVFRDATLVSHRLQIRDGAGRVVRELAAGGSAVPPLSFVWDGRDQSGRLLPDGPYQVRVTPSAPADAQPSEPVSVVLDTDRSSVLAALGTPFQRLTALRGKVPQVQTVAPDLLYSIGASASISGVLVAPVLEYDVVAGGAPLPRVRAESWLLQAQALGLNRLLPDDLHYANNGHELLLSVSEAGAGISERRALWVVSLLDSAAPRRIGAWPGPGSVLGELADGRIVLGASDGSGLVLVDRSTSSFTPYRSFAVPGSSIQRVLGQGLLLERGNEPVAFVPVDPARPVVPLPATQSLPDSQSRPSLTGLNAAGSHLLVRLAEAGQGRIELVELISGQRTVLASGPLVRLQAPLVLDSFDDYSLDAQWLEDGQALVYDSIAHTASWFGTDGLLRERQSLGGFRRQGPYSVPSVSGRRVVTTYPGGNGLLVALTDPWDQALRLTVGESAFVCPTDGPECLPFFASGYEFGYGISDRLRLARGLAPVHEAGRALLPMSDLGDQLRYPAGVGFNSDVLAPDQPLVYYPSGAVRLPRGYRIRSEAREVQTSLSIGELWGGERHAVIGVQPAAQALSTLANLTTVLTAQSLGPSIRLKGTVSDAALASWQLDFRREGENGAWRSLSGPQDAAVIDALLLDWVPPEPGAWRIRLRAQDLAGNQRESFAFADAAGAPPAIGEVQLASRWLSPNGDGRLDSLLIRYRVDAPTTANFVVRSIDSGQVVREFNIIHGAGALGAHSLQFDGRNNAGQLLADGEYQLELAPGFRLPLRIDTRAPEGLFDWQVQLPFNSRLPPCAGNFFSPGLLAYSDSDDLRFPQRGSQALGSSTWSDTPVQLSECAQPIAASRALDHRWRLLLADAAGNQRTLSLPPVAPALSLQGLFGSSSSLVLPQTALQSLFVDLSPGLTAVRIEARDTSPGSTWAALGQFPATRVPLSEEQMGSSQWLGHAVLTPLDLTAQVPGSWLALRGVGLRNTGTALESNPLLLQIGRFDPPSLEAPLLGRCDAYLPEPLLPRPWSGMRLRVRDASGAEVAVIEGARMVPSGFRFDAAVPPGLWDLQAELTDGDGVLRRSVFERSGCAEGMAPERVVVSARAERQSDQCDAPADHRMRLLVQPDESRPPASFARRYRLQLANPLTQAVETLLDVQVAANTALPDFERLLNVNAWPAGQVRVTALIGDRRQDESFEVTAGWQPQPLFQTPAAGSLQCGQDFPVRLRDAASPSPNFILAEWGVGSAPTNWFPASLSNTGVGTLRLSAQANLPHGLSSVRVRAASADGAVVCAARAFEIDARVDAFRRATPTTIVPGLVQMPVGLSSVGEPEFRQLQIPLSSLESVAWSATVAPASGAEPLTPSGPELGALGPAQTLNGDYNLDWDGRLGGNFLADGRYVLRVQARDGCGHTEVFPTSLRVDSTPPQLELLGPASGATVDAAVLEVRGTVSDGLGYTLKVELAAATPDQWILLPPGGAPGVLARHERALAQGPHRLRLTATDLLGNRSVLLRDFVYAPPTRLLGQTAAEPALFSPNADGVQEQLRIGIELKAAVLLDVSLMRGNTVLRNLASAASHGVGLLELSWDGRDGTNAVVSDGPLEVRVRATHPSDGTQEVQVLLATIDTLAPALDALMPAGTEARCEAPLSVEVQDLHLAGVLAQLRDSSGVLLRELSTSENGALALGTLAAYAELGSVSLSLSAQDLAGNRRQRNQQWTLDCTAPLASFQAPPDGAVLPRLSTPVVIAGTASDARLLDYQLQWASAPGSNWMAITTGTTSVSAAALGNWTVNAPDGPVSLRLRVRDRAGNQTEALRAVIVDGTAPTSQLSAPPDGATLTDQLVVRGTASDANFDHYELQLARAVSGPWATIHTASMAVTDGELASLSIPVEGEFFLRLRVYDRAGLSTVTNPIRLTLDAQPPPAPIQLSAQVEQNRDVRLSWSAVTVADLAGYALERDGQSLGQSPLAATSFLDRDAPEGTLHYQVRAIDLAGNLSAPAQTSASVDRTPPLLALLAPSAGARERGEVVVIGSVSTPQDDDLDQYTLEFRPTLPPGPPLLLRSSGQTVITGELGRLDGSLFGTSETRGVLRLVATDQHGNGGQLESPLVIDQLPPAAPTGLNLQSAGLDLRVQWNANSESDLLGYLLYRNGVPVNASGAVPSDLRALALAASLYLDPAVPDGAHVYRVYAIDQAGNLSPASAPVTRTIETGPPSAQFLVPEAGAAFEQHLEVIATTLDEDVSRVEFSWRPSGSGPWTELASIGTPPWRVLWSPAQSVALGDYELRAIAVDTGERRDPNPPVRAVRRADLTAPENPASFTATADADEVRLSWPAVTASDLAGYVLTRIDSAGNPVELTASPLGAVEYLDSGLTDGRWSYTVQAVDHSGNRSTGRSDEAQVSGLELEVPFTPTLSAAVDLVGVASVPGQLLLQRSPEFASPPAAANTGEEGGFLLPAVPLAEGNNVLTLRVRSAAGDVSRPAVLHLDRANRPTAPPGLSAQLVGNQIQLAWTPIVDPTVIGVRLSDRGEWIPALAPLDQTLNLQGSCCNPEAAADGDPSTSWSALADGAVLEWHWPTPALVDAVGLEWTQSLPASEIRLEAWSGHHWIDQLGVRELSPDDQHLLKLTRPYRTTALRLRVLAAPAGFVRLAESSIQILPLLSGSSHLLPATDGLHQFTLTAWNWYGYDSLPSAPPVVLPVGDAQAPPAPELSGTAVGNEARLQWNPSTAPDLARYLLARDGEVIATIAANAPTSFSDGPLANGQYRYRLNAVDQVGNVSPPSNEILIQIAATGPATPQLDTVRPSPGGQALELAWTAGTGGAEVVRFEIARSETAEGPYLQVHLADAAIRTWVDATVRNGETRWYQLRALDAQGNASAWSNRRSGTAGDQLAPATPLLFVPSWPEMPVRWDVRSLPVCGRAEPGVSVQMRHNGASVGAPLVALDSDLRTLLPPLQLTTQNVWLAPHGDRYLAEVDLPAGGRGAEVRSLLSPLPQPTIKLSAAPLLPVLPARAEIVLGAHSGSGELTSWPLVRGATQSTGVPVSAAATLTSIRALLTSADGQRLVLAAAQAGTSGLWLLDLNQAAPAPRRLSGIDPDTLLLPALRLSADGSLLLLTGLDGSLRLLDLDLGIAQTLAGTADLSAALPVMSADAAVVAWVAAGSNGFAVRQQLLGSSESTQLAAYASAPAWLGFFAGGRELGVIDTELERYVVSNGQPLGASDLGLNGRIPRAIRHADSDRLLLLLDPGETDVLSTVDLAGRFCLRDVPTVVGLNRYSATASDGSNSSAAAAEVIVEVPGAGLPDLEVRDLDLRFSPAAVSVGQSVLAFVSVHNRGAVAASAGVRMQLLAPDGQVRELPASLPTLAAGASHSLSLNLGSPGQAGQWKLLVRLDPTNALPESNEGNNEASANLVVTSGALPALELTLASGTLQPGAILTGQVRVVTPAAFQGRVQVQVRDAGGVLVSSLLDTATGALQAGTAWSAALSWSPQTAAGEYQVQARLLSLSGATLAERTAPVRIVVQRQVLLSMRTDRAAYTQSETANLQLGVHFQSGNALLQQARLRVQARSSAGGPVVWSLERSLGTLTPGLRVEQQLGMPLLAFAPDSYTLELALSANDGFFEQVSTSLMVLPAQAQAGVLGQLKTNPTGTIGLGQGASLDWILRNTGAAALGGVQTRVRLLTSPGLTEIATDQQTLNLDGQQQIQRSLVVPAASLLLGEYLGVLEARLPGDPADSWRRLAQASLRVVDGTPPQIVIERPLPAQFLPRPSPIRARITDVGTGVDRAEMRLDSGSWTAIGVVEEGRYGRTVESLAEGTHQLQVRAWDRQGNQNDSALILFEVDATPPLITITGVSDGQQTRDPVTPVVQFSDANLRETSLRLNGQPYVSGTPVNTEGNWVLGADAVDAAGNRSTRVVLFNIDRSGPQVLFAAPAQGDVFATDTIVARLISEVGVAVQLQSGSWSASQTSDAQGQVQFLNVPLVPGANTLSASATDLAGNQGPLATLQVQRLGGNASWLGDVTPVQAELPLGEPLQIDLRVENQGTAPRVGSFRVQVLPPNGAAAVSTTEFSHSFAAGEVHLRSLNIPTSGFALGQHALVLDLLEAGVPQQLDASAVSLVDRGPPLLEILAPPAVVGPVIAPRVRASDALTTISVVRARLDGGPWSDLPALAGQAQQYGLTDLSVSEGPHLIEFEALDAAGNRALAERTFESDQSAPQILLAGVSEGQLSNTPLTPVFSAIDPHPGTLVARLDGQLFSSGTEVGSEGEHLLELIATDALGNRSTLNTRFRIDRSPPNLVFQSPAEGAIVVSASITVTGVTEPAASVLLLRGSDQYTVLADAQGGFIVAGVQLSPGTNRLSARATDAAGNIGPSRSIDIEYRANFGLQLAVEIGAPSPHPHGANLPVSVSVQNTGTVAAQNLPLRLDARRLGQSGLLDRHERSLNLAAAASSSFAHGFSTGSWSLAEIELRLEAQLTLANGSLVWSPLATSVISLQDMQPPTVNWLVPAAGSWHGLSVQVRATASDSLSAIEAVEAQLGTGAWVGLPVLSAGLYEGAVPTSDEGVVPLRLRARDVAGNSRELPARNVQIDRQLPQVQILDVVDGQIGRDPVTPRIVVNDANATTIVATLDGQAYAPNTVVNTEGMHLLRVEARDPAANLGVAEVRFTIDRSPPKISLIQPINGATLNSTEVTLIGDSEAGARLSASVLGITQQTIADSQGRFSFVVMLARGPNTIVLTAADALGNTTAPLNVQVTVIADPVISLLGAFQGLPNTLNHGQTLEFSTRVRNVGNTHLPGLPLSVRVETTGKPVITVAQTSWTIDLQVLAHAERALSLASSSWPAGTLRVVFEAEVDIADRRSGRGGPTRILLASQNFEVLDRAPPVLDWRVPASAGAVLNRDQSIEVEASDVLTGITRVELRFDQAAIWSAMAPLDLALTRWALPLGELPAGAHQVEVRAFDGAGNQASLSPRPFSIRRILPLEIIEPANGALTASPMLDLRGRTEAGARVSVSRQGQLLRESIADHTGEFRLTQVPLEFGLNRLRLLATAADSATSAPVEWTLERRGLQQIPVTTLDPGHRSLLVLLLAAIGLLSLWTTLHRTRGGL